MKTIVDISMLLLNNWSKLSKNIKEIVVLVIGFDTKWYPCLEMLDWKRTAADLKTTICIATICIAYFYS